MTARRRSKRSLPSASSRSQFEENAEPSNEASRSQRRRRLNSEDPTLAITSDVERELAQYTFDLQPITSDVPERNDWEENGWEPFEYSADFIPSDNELLQQSEPTPPPHKTQTVVEECPICYVPFDSEHHKQAKPSVCTHILCESCLREWSQQTTRCPFCKREYISIVILDEDGEREVAVSPREHGAEDAEEEDADSTDESSDSADHLADLLAIGDFVVPDGCVICGLNRGDLTTCYECQFAAHDNRCHNFHWDSAGRSQCSVCATWQSRQNAPSSRRHLLNDGLLARLLRQVETRPARGTRRTSQRSRRTRPAAPPAPPRRRSRRRS